MKWKSTFCASAIEKTVFEKLANSNETQKKDYFLSRTNEWRAPNFPAMQRASEHNSSTKKLSPLHHRITLVWLAFSENAIHWIQEEQTNVLSIKGMLFDTCVPYTISFVSLAHSFLRRPTSRATGRPHWMQISFGLAAVFTIIASATELIE